LLTTKTGSGLVSGAAPHSNEGPMMEIKVLRGFVFEGRDIRKGSVVDVPENFARQMIHLGRAEPTENGPKRKAGRPKKSE